MKLYHGTNTRHLPGILERGIRPRRHHQNSNWDIASNRDCVYLTDAYALYFAASSCPSNDDSIHPVVLEIDSDELDQARLVPDEDLLEQATRNTDSLPKGWTMERRTRWYRKRLTDFNHVWQDSVQFMGNCAYHGTVPVPAITRVATIDPNKQRRLLWMGMDPTITVMNYRIVGDKYRNICRWLFDDSIEDGEMDRQLSQMENRPEHFKTTCELLRSFGRDGIHVDNLQKPE